MRKQNKYYNLKDAMYEYHVQDIPDPEMNKRYCIVDRNLVLDYVEFRDLLMKFGIVDRDLKHTAEIQTPIQKIGESNESKS